MKKNKLPLIALAVSFLIGVFGGTLAYYSGSARFTNEFQAAKFKTKTTENFTAPTNWRAGEEIPNTVVTKNEGTIPVAVRLSYTERWEDGDGNPLNISNAVTINFDNLNRWQKIGDYYYYKSQLNPGFSTKSLIKSVKLNEEVGDVTCTSSANGLEQVCETTGEAAGKKYILLINIETVDIEQYQDVWNTDLVIGEYENPIQFVNRDNEDEITPGDLVKVGNTEEFYVVSSDENETVLLAHYNLNVGTNKNPDVTEGIQHESAVAYKDNASQYGGIIFVDRSYWKNKVGEGLDYPGSYSDPNYPYVYDSNSDLYNYIENYKTNLEQEGIIINSARLLSYQEAIELSCSENSCLSASDWVYGTTYWLGSAKSDGTVFSIITDGDFSNHMIPYGFDDYSPVFTTFNPGVRPVIVVSTLDILE